MWMIPIALTALSAAPAPVTFYKDVLPVLQKNCQQCHRPGEAAPMALLDYDQVRPWARAIKESVLAKRMPPWFADPAYGKFHNARVLSEQEKQTLVSWANAGAPKGDPQHAPAPLQWVDGWNIGNPDRIIEMPAAYHVPAEGTIEYTYVVLPLNLTEDTWVQAAEVRPGDRAVVHHVIAFLREPTSKWMRDAEYGVPFVPKKSRSEAGGPGSELLVGYAPGLQPFVYEPGTAKLLKKGTDVVFQLHYTANGKATTDQTRIGLIFAKQPPQKRAMTLAATNAKFVIPPGADNHRVDSKFTFQAGAELLGLMPHMHLRGKSFEYEAVYPTGEREKLLSVPRYDFNWQLFYNLKQRKPLPKGTTIECVAHFDNSANNRFNPDPSKEVRWGDQSWEEMMIGWFDVAFDAQMDPAKLFRKEKRPSAGAGQ
jgi:hypothetical protein